MVSSPKGPTHELGPMGRPLSLNPAGTEMPQVPPGDRMVKMSDRYILERVVSFSPIRKAGGGRHRGEGSRPRVEGPDEV